MEIESQLRGVSSGQPQLFVKIARSHDLRALPEQCDLISPGIERTQHSRGQFEVARTYMSTVLHALYIVMPGSITNPYCMFVE
jgi:hypothetical protein